MNPETTLDLLEYSLHPQHLTVVPCVKYGNHSPLTIQGELPNFKRSYERCFSHDCWHEPKHWFKAVSNSDPIPLLAICDYHKMIFANKIRNFLVSYKEISYDEFITTKVISE